MAEKSETRTTTDHDEIRSWVAPRSRGGDSTLVGLVRR